jgi:hypothetical protein
MLNTQAEIDFRKEFERKHLLSKKRTKDEVRHGAE